MCGEVNTRIAVMVILFFKKLSLQKTIHEKNSSSITNSICDS